MKRAFLSVLCFASALVVWDFASRRDGGMPCNAHEGKRASAENHKAGGVYECPAKESKKQGQFQIVSCSQASGSGGDVTWFAQEGAKVEAGDIVIKCRQAQGRLDMWKAQLEQAEAELEVKHHLLKKWQSRFVIFSKLGANGTTATSELDDIRHEQDAAVAAVKAAEKAVVAAKAIYDPWPITCLISGQVIWTNPDDLCIGAAVQNYQSPLPLMKIADLREMEVLAPCRVDKAQAQVFFEGKAMKVLSQKETDKGLVVRFANPDLLVQYNQKVVVKIGVK